MEKTQRISISSLATLSAFALTSLLACGMSYESETTEKVSSPVVNKVAAELPASVVKVQVKGFLETNTNPYSQGDINACHGVLLDQGVVLTAAHCFSELDVKYPIETTILGQKIGKSAVTFHPKAWSDGATELSSTRPHKDSVNGPYDFAIVRLSTAVSDHPVARLWNPGGASAPNLAGRKVRFGGHDNGFNNGPATGEQTLGAAAQGLLVGNRSPSGAQPGDSGGGAFLTLSEGLPGSAPVNAKCAPTLGQPGDQVLVGINQATDGVNDYFAPVFTTEIVTWVSSFLGDFDRDGVCDAVDNCPLVANDQLNCNALAETTSAWGGDGVERGDACDPVPCAYGQPAASEFVPYTTDLPVMQNGYFVTRTHGRQIEDRLQLTPVIGQGRQAEIRYSYYFCDCRAPSGEPITDPEVCALPPYNCQLDPMLLDGKAIEAPATEAGASGKRAWYQMTVSYPSDKSSISHPGPTQEVVWDYKADFEKWQAAGFVSAPPVDVKFGPGTNLAGLVWVHAEPTTMELGVGVHGLPDCPIFTALTEPCMISDSFITDVAPDRRVTQGRGNRVPVLRPAPFWTYCPNCRDGVQLPGDILFEPMPLLGLEPAAGVAWSYQGGTAVDVAGFFSPLLMRGLANPSMRFVSASEPLGIANGYDQARAYAISSDGTTLLGQVVAEGPKLGLREQRVTLDRVARSGFGAVYSRLTRSLYVFGGSSLSRDVPELVIHRDGQGVERRKLGGALPGNVRAAVYSHRDHAIVGLDERGVWFRIALADAAASRVDSLPTVSASEVELGTLEDGRVILLENGEKGAAAHIVEFENGAARVTGSLELGSAKASLVGVRTGIITVALTTEGREQDSVQTLPLDLADFGLAPLSL